MGFLMKWQERAVHQTLKDCSHLNIDVKFMGMLIIYPVIMAVTEVDDSSFFTSI